MQELPRNMSLPSLLHYLLALHPEMLGPVL